MSAIIYCQNDELNPCTLPMRFRCIKAFMLDFSGRLSRRILEKSLSIFLYGLSSICQKEVRQRKKYWYPTLYQSWRRMPVYFECSVSASYSFANLRVDRFFRYMPNYCDMHFPNYFPFHFKVANSLYCRLSVNTAGACDLTLGVKGGCRPLR